MIKFGTGGFRGVINEEFNKDNVMLIAQAISNIIINKNKVHSLPKVIR